MVYSCFLSRHLSLFPSLIPFGFLAVDKYSVETKNHLRRRTRSFQCARAPVINHAKDGAVWNRSERPNEQTPCTWERNMPARLSKLRGHACKMARGISRQAAIVDTFTASHLCLVICCADAYAGLAAAAYLGTTWQSSFSDAGHLVYVTRRPILHVIPRPCSSCLIGDRRT
jgi:hypothetical protein